MISFIVSAFDRPLLLPGCLWSLAAQTHKDFEVIVTDNATDPKIAAQHKRAVEMVRDWSPKFARRFKYVRTANKIEVSDCYWAAEYAIKHHARGNWYCFPCDDSYYVPDFARRMLTAAYQHGWVICGQAVVGPEASGGSGYRVWNQTPGKSIKTTFMVKANKFPGFAGKPSIPQAMAADYAFTATAARTLPWGTVNETMVCHN